MTLKIDYSKLIAGTMTWGSWGKDFAPNEMAKKIMYCKEIGISTFDHADIYGGYGTEAEFGKALEICDLERESVQLISKCGIQMNSEKRPNEVKHYDYTREYIISSVEGSLKNLRTDYLDVLLLHRPSPMMNPEIIAEAIHTLKSSGKIKNFGVSNFKPSQIAMLSKFIDVDANQVEFSLTQNEVMYDGTLDDCIANSRIPMSWSPLGSVFKEKTNQTLRIKNTMKPMLAKYEASEDQLLLAWILQHPAEVKPVVGTTTESRLAKAVAASQIKLELTDWFLLLEASKGNEVP